MSTTKNIPIAFITDDIVIKDFDFSNIDRYEFTAKKLDQKEYDFTGDSKAFKNWANDHLSFEELYEVPMMTSVHCYPSFVSFKKEDRYKVAPTTTLFFDNKEQAWAVGLTGGGMDLAPHLLDTFINLDSGIPLHVASAIRKDYPAYIKQEKHNENCNTLASACEKQATKFTGMAKRLRV